MTNTLLEIGTRVKVISAPPSIAHFVNKEGYIVIVQQKDGYQRFHVAFDTGSRHWFYAAELQALPAVANLVAAVEVYEQPIEPPLSPFSPPSDDPADYLLPVPDFDVREYVEADTLQQRQNDAVLHEAPALNGIRKGDLARVQTSNPRVPFVGRVAKLLWDGRVCVKQGDVCYWTTLGRVAVLSRVEG